MSQRISPLRRWLRILLWAALAGSATLAALTAVLRVPAVQTWLAKRIVATQPGWSLEAERIDLGPGGLDARGVDFSMPGLVAKSEPISVRVRPGRLLRREFAVEQVSVDKLVIEITPAKLSSSSSASGPFSGVLELLQAPLAWTVAKTDIKARVDVRDEGKTVASGDLTLSGGNLSAATLGVFSYTLSAASALLPASPDNVIRSEGTLRIVQDPARNGVARIELDGDLRLPGYGAFTPPPGRLSLVLEHTPAGERYRAVVDFGDEARLTILSGFNPKDKYTGFDVRISAKPAFLARLDPRLASFGGWQARLISSLDINAPRPLPRDTSLVVTNDASPFRFTLTQQGEARAARAEFSGLPLAWSAPFLEGTGLKLSGDGSAAGAWNAVLDERSGKITASPASPLVIGPVSPVAPGLPPILPLTFTLGPSLELSKDKIAVSVPDFIAATGQGDRVEAAFTAERSLADSRTHAAGSLSGALPTLLAGPDRPLPFLVAARWDAALAADGSVGVDALEFSARPSASASPFVSLALKQPLGLGASPSVASIKADPSRDLLLLSVKNLPLAWLSRWIPGVAVAGTWTSGESALRHADGGGFAFVPRAPWTFSALEFAPDGKTVFAGDADIEPEFTWSPELWSARLRSFSVSETAGNRASGDASFDWKPAAKAFAASLNLDAKLPSLPHAAGTFGALDVSLKAKAATVEGKVAQMETLALSVRNAAGPLLTLATTQPFLFVNKPNGETIFSSYGPLRLQTAPLPLAWAKPWLPPGMEVSGTLGATDLIIHAEPQKFRLRPLTPLVVEHLTVVQNGADTVRDARVSFYPGADVQLLHQLEPSFQIVFQGRVHATEGSLDIGKKRAADFEASIGFIGNDEQTLPQSVDLLTRAELGVLDPRRSGSLVARLNGAMLGGEPLDFWARLDDIPGVPPLEVSAHGNVDGRKREAGFDVGIRYLTTPVESDAAFRVTLALDSDTLTFDSALRGKFMDVTAALALVEALDPDAPAAPAVAKPATPPPATPAAVEPKKPVARMARLGKPFWSVLRGHFDLELGAVQFAPYRIERVGGRLDVAEKRLTLSDLTGTMFSGKWSGGLAIDYAGDDPVSDHRLSGAFRIEQFETARVVQTVFPNEFGSFDARINLDARLRSDGNGLWELLNRAEGDFTIEGRDGVARLTHPAAGTAATVLVLGGAVTFSPELRALGRLLRKFAEMPVDTLRVSGARDAAGNISLDEFLLVSPQARLAGRGSVPAEEGVALAGRRIDLALELFARDEIGVILGNMKLLDKKPGADGYRRMTQPVRLGGEVGRPDASPLYDLLARAATGSRGTWGLIMRKVRREVEKQRAAEAKKAAP